MSHLYNLKLRLMSCSYIGNFLVNMTLYHLRLVPLRQNKFSAPMAHLLNAEHS